MISQGRSWRSSDCGLGLFSSPELFNWQKILITLVTLFALGNSLNSLASEKRFSLVLGEFPPYTINEEPIHGLNIEIIKAAFAAVDYELTVEVMPFARALHYAKIGKADGLVLWHNLERERWFVFSASLSRSNIVFLKRKSLNYQFNSIESLTPFTIGVVNDYAYTPEFLTAEGLNKQTVGTDEQNLHKLLADRIDLVVIDERMASYLMRKHYPEHKKDFDSAGVLQFEDFYLAMSKKGDNYYQKMIDFNNGLARITKNGKLQEINQRYK